MTTLKRLRRGFTLIELLIVITIIGILAVALVPSIVGAPVRARDSSRKAVLSNAVTAIEAFQADNGRLPDDHSTRCLEAVDTAEAARSDGGSPLSNYFSGKAFPVDPSGATTLDGTNSCHFVYDNLGSGSYALYTRNEGGKGNTAAVGASNAQPTAASSGNFYYVLQ